MQILFISQYYYPEIGAASERITGFARYLKKYNYDVTVITGFPNYPFGKIYKGYKKTLFAREEKDGANIWRLWLYTSEKNNIISRLLNYISFMISSFIAGLFVKNIDIVIATSGPIFVGLSGYLISAIKRKPFILDVRDIWPERIYAGTNIKRNLFLKVLEKLEAFLYKKAHKIIAVTEGVKNNIISKKVKEKKVKVITNGVDPEMFYAKQKNEKLLKNLGLYNKFIIIYAGTLGLLQDLDLILNAAEKLNEKKEIVFLILGRGARLEYFLSKINEKGLSNVKVLPPKPPEELVDYINLSDIGINTNTSHHHNRMAIPVKMFIYLACGKPVVFANEGEVYSIINDNKVGICVHPGDIDAFCKAILLLYHNRDLYNQYSQNGLRLVREKFSRNILVNKLINLIHELKLRDPL